MLNRLIHWLFVEPRHFWVALLVPAAALLVCTKLFVSEPAIRLTGLVLQLLGILTAVWGIVETWKYFKLGDPLRRLHQWLRRCPLRKLPPVTGSMTATEQSDSLSAHGYTWWQPKPTASVEERLEILEKNIPLINDRITGTQNTLNAAVEQVQHQLQHSAAKTQAATQELSDKLTDFGTGSLHISAIGAFWVFVGSVLGSASPEILRLVQ